MCITHTHTHTLHCGRVFNCISSSNSSICVWRTADGSCNYHTSETNNGRRNTAGAGREQEGSSRGTGQVQVQQRETELSARKMKPIQKQTPGATSALDEY